MVKVNTQILTHYFVWQFTCTLHALVTPQPIFEEHFPPLPQGGDLQQGPWVRHAQLHQSSPLLFFKLSWRYSGEGGGLTDKSIDVIFSDFWKRHGDKRWHCWDTVILYNLYKLNVIYSWRHNSVTVSTQKPKSHFKSCSWRQQRRLHWLPLAACLADSNRGTVCDCRSQIQE